MSSSAHHDGVDKAPLQVCQNGRGDILALQFQVLLALPLTGHASLQQEWLLTIIALSMVQAGLPFVHYCFSVEKMFKPPESGAIGWIGLILEEQILLTALAQHPEYFNSAGSHSNHLSDYLLHANPPARYLAEQSWDDRASAGGSDIYPGLCWMVLLTNDRCNYRNQTIVSYKLWQSIHWFFHYPCSVVMD